MKIWHQICKSRSNIKFILRAPFRIKKWMVSMKKKSARATLWTIPLLVLGGAGVLTQPSAASSANVACDTHTATPTVIVTVSERASSEDVPILNFLPQYFSFQEALNNCQNTAKSLQSLYEREKIKYLTSDRLNQRTVVCAVERRGIGCDHYSARVLFTLNQAANPSQVLYDMLGKDFKRSSPPNSRTVSRIYSDIRPSWWPF